MWHNNISENSKEWVEKILQMVGKFNKIMVYKFNIKISGLYM
jgi:hypothetical protein